LTQEITIRIKELGSTTARAQLLMTVPAISYYSSLLILSEIGQIERFPSAKHLCSYAGLVRSVYSSGSKSFHGRITKQGSRWLGGSVLKSVSMRPMEMPRFRVYIAQFAGAGDWRRLKSL